MKKIFIVIMSLVIAFGLSGCQSKSDQEKVIDEFFDDLLEAKFSKIEKLTTENAQGVDEYINFGYNFFGFKYQDSEIFDKFLKTLVGQVCQSYEIESVDEKDSQCIVKVKLQIKDLKDAALVNQEDLQKKAIEYADEHQEELLDLYQMKGQEAMYTKIYEQILPDMTPVIKDALKDQKTKKETLKFVLKEKDDQWLIDEIEALY